LRNRAFRPVVAIISLLLLTGVPTHAAPIAVTDVVQVLSNYHSGPDIRLRNIPQSTSLISNGFTAATGAGVRNDDFFSDNSTGLSVETDDLLLTGIGVNSDPQQTDLIALGDVDGTVCDCGEILVAGGFPKWPLAFLAAIPFLFIHDCETCDQPPPPLIPTPTPPSITPTPTPEPAALLLFGSSLAALGAGLRRRHARVKLSNSDSAEGEA